MKSVHKIAAATQQKCSRFFTKDIAANRTRAKENILTLQITVFNTLKQRQMSIDTTGKLSYSNIVATFYPTFSTTAVTTSTAKAECTTATPATTSPNGAVGSLI